MIPLTNKQKESDEKQKVCHICRKEFSSNNLELLIKIAI